MNILQHKSWHVYNQKNRDKVKRDEANAEVEQKRTEERAVAADREHRLAVLRQRAERRMGNTVDHRSTEDAPTEDDTKAVAGPPPRKEHINFWADLEKQDTKVTGGNPEREQEAKAQKEKWDRTIAMHLDTGIKGNQPWYLSRHAASMESSRKSKGGDREFTKVRDDPLQAMKHMLDKHEKHKSVRSKSPPSRSRPHRRFEAPQQSSRQEPEGMSKMDRLRQERLERERAESRKTRELLHPSPPSSQGNTNERQRGYNQQFNPAATSMAHSNRHVVTSRHNFTEREQGFSSRRNQSQEDRSYSFKTYQHDRRHRPY